MSIERAGVMRCLAASVIACALLLATRFAAPAQAAEQPALKLLAAERKASFQLRGRSLRISPGLFVAATGGDFELRRERPGFGPWRTTVIDPETGAVLATLPSRLVDGRHGLDQFIRLGFRRGGEEVAVRRLSFCPNSFDRQRVDESSAPNPRYPYFCNDSFPFVRGDVWGIDEGWATAVGGGRVTAANLSTGRYRVVAEIHRRYRQLLGIPLAAARQSLRVRVRKRRGIRLLRERGPERGALRREPLTAGDPDPETLPDLVALPAWGIRTRRKSGRELLAFASTPWNAGPAPLDVEGFRREGEDDMEAFQYRFDSEGRVVGREPVGVMAFDTRDHHHHWHFEQFVRYRLLDASRERVTRSRKQSFCIVPTNPVDLTLPGAVWRPPLYAGVGADASVCGRSGSLWIRQRLDAGWGDTYLQSVAGQAFDITRVPNGTYYVEVEVNPRGELYETTEANNVERRRIRLVGKPGVRKVRVAPWRGIEG